MELLIGVFKSTREIVIFDTIPFEEHRLKRALRSAHTVALYRSWSGLLRRLTNESGRLVTWTRSEAREGAQLHIGFDSIRRIAAVDPWPAFRLEYVEVGVPHSYEASIPEGMFDPNAPRERVAPTIHNFLTLAQNLDLPLTLGWFGHGHVPLERVKGFPADKPTKGYRVSGRAERLVARFHPLSPAEYLTSWLASSPSRPWRDSPREAALSERYLYVRHGLRGYARLPLSALRARLGGTEEDAVYVFGQRTYVVLPYRDDDPLRPKLDLHLHISVRG